jgi:glycosyltransferase involved in cell wall biosynthesis
LEKFHPTTNGEWVKKKYSLSEDEDLVLYIGQLHGAQYVDLFIKSANVILHKRDKVRFMIVGEGFLEPNLRKLVYSFGLEDKVIFAGAIEHDDIPYYVAAASVCVAPFRDTDVTRCKSPLKIVEYMAAGKAIAASNVGEVRKMLGGVGILTDPGDSHALAEGILKLLRDKTLRENLGKAARLRAEKRYNWPNTVSALIGAYRRVIDRK